MTVGRWTQVRDWAMRRFPERHVYLRSGGEMRTYTLSPARQMAFAALTGAVLAWTAISTTIVGLSALSFNVGDEAASRTKAYYERLIADRQARLNSAVAQLTQGPGTLDGLAHSIEKRHAALAMLLTDVRGAPGVAGLLAPVTPAKLAGRTAVDQVQAVRDDQEKLVEAAEGYAHTRAERLRLAFRLAGLDPAAFSGRATDGEGLGGPLIEAKDASALAAILDVDDEFAGRIQSAAQDLNAMRSLSTAAETLPLQKPVSSPMKSSGFGVRFDPFTGRPAFHAGQDFAGAYMTPIFATAPGIVSFTGQRAGYGNTVEIDHGGGFKTRYAHLEGISVRPGQRVGVGQRVGAMGSTGRSTGTHLHYEIWQNGRVQDPTRFLKAGDYVQQVG